jgi:predicted TIM-barrel fold metal-dependent hydrolase
MSTDDLFVIDAVAHAYNLPEENFADARAAGAITELAYALASGTPDPRYAVPREVYVSDWSVEDTAALLFHESITDAAIMHPLPIYAYKDGLVSIEKAAEARQKYPNRFIGAYACVDPLMGDRAIRSLEQQVDMFHPLGVKLYPTSWSRETPKNYRMDDPEIMFPFYEKVGELGLRVVAVHKAVPTGPLPMEDAYGTRDVEGAAYAFPDLNFEIVHGGLAFMEETAWLMAGHQNVWLNTEIWNIVLERRPRRFAQLLLDLMSVGGMEVLDRVMWGSGTVLYHPRPTLEAFLEFEIPEDLLEGGTLFEPVGQLSSEQKSNILGRNCARLHGFDLEAARRAIQNDEFSRGAGEPLPEPYSTTSRAADIANAKAPVNV